MADAFIGKWQVDLSCTSGLAEFGAAVGMPAEKIELYQKLPYSLEFGQNGDVLSCTVKFDKEGIPAQNYTFKLGEEFDYTSVDGNKSKLTVTMDGDKLKEVYTAAEGKTWSTVREISGGVMTTTTCVPGGPSAVQKLNKA